MEVGAEGPVGWAAAFLPLTPSSSSSSFSFSFPSHSSFSHARIISVASIPDMPGRLISMSMI